MTWKELKDAIDHQLTEKNLDPSKVDIWYFDISEKNPSIFQYSIHIQPKTSFSDRRFRLWMD